MNISKSSLPPDVVNETTCPGNVRKMTEIRRGSISIQQVQKVSIFDGCPESVSSSQPEIKRLEDFKIAPHCEFAGKLRSSAEISFIEKPGYASTAKIPICFIWTGSFIPDKYAENIFNWANAYPERRTVLWITSTLLTREDQECMRCFARECPENVMVMDTVENPLLNKIGFSEIEHWMFNGFKTMSNVEITRTACAYSDVLRVLLMYYGTELLDGVMQANPDNKNREVEYDGMIYLDTDINYKSLNRMDDLYFKGILFKHKPIFPLLTTTSNDVFATSHARSDYFSCLMHEVLMKTFELMSQYSSCADFVRPAADDLRSNELRIAEFSYQPADSQVDKHYGGFSHYSEHRMGAKHFPFIETTGNDFSWIDGRALDFKRSMFRPKSILQRSAEYLCAIL